MIRKQLIFSHGEKGGVGKSTIATLIIEHLLKSGHRLYIAEGDPSVGDVANRYRGVVHGAAIPLARSGAAEEACAELLDRLEAVYADEADVVVVNLPGSASDTVDRLAPDLIGPVASELGIDVRTVFAIGPGEASVEALSESMQHGLGSISARVVAVPNEVLGDSSRFAWVRSAARGVWIEDGLPEVILFRLAARCMERLRDRPGTIGAIAAGDTTPRWSAVHRTLLRQWLRVGEQILQTLEIGEPDQEVAP